MERLIERAHPRAGSLAKKYLEKAGVHVNLNEPVLGIKGGAVITARQRLKADCIVWAIGIRPKLAFMKGSGILSSGKNSI